MEFVLPRPSGALHLLGAVSREALRGLRARRTPFALVSSRYALVSVLEEIAVVAEQLAENVATSGSGQTGANAASVCRWQLGRIRERAQTMETDGADRTHQAAILRRLDQGVTAAQILSAGYRFHSLDRVCRGGTALDDQFEALARLRIKLVAGG